MKNQSKNITAVLITLFISIFIAWQAHANQKTTPPKLPPRVMSHEIKWFDVTPNKHPTTCLSSATTTFCATNESNLIDLIKRDGEAKPEPLEVITATITQYSRADSCHNINKKGECLMASGRPVYEGAVACPYDMKLGTKVLINNKTYTCEDRTAKWVQKRNGPTFDIFVNSNPHGAYKTKVTIL